MYTTLWAKIAADLRQGIQDGTYPPGSKLPSIPDLMTKYGVARDTVRDAISRLANEGLVTPLRGVGTVVRDMTPVELAYSPEAPAQPWSQQTKNGRDDVVLAELVDADPGVIQRLRLPKGSQVLHRVRHQSVGGQVAQIHDQWIPADLYSSIANATQFDLIADRTKEQPNLYEQMRKAGRRPATATETLTCRMPDPDETTTLELPPGVPVLVTHRITTDRDGTPLETSTFVGAGDRMSQTFRVPLES